SPDPVSTGAATSREEGGTTRSAWLSAASASSRVPVSRTQRGSPLSASTTASRSRSFPKVPMTTAESPRNPAAITLCMPRSRPVSRYASGLTESAGPPGRSSTAPSPAATRASASAAAAIAVLRGCLRSASCTFFTEPAIPLPYPRRQPPPRVRRRPRSGRIRSGSGQPVDRGARDAARPAAGHGKAPGRRPGPEAVRPGSGLAGHPAVLVHPARGADLDRGGAPQRAGDHAGLQQLQALEAGGDRLRAAQQVGDGALLVADRDGRVVG